MRNDKWSLVLIWSCLLRWGEVSGIKSTVIYLLSLSGYLCHLSNGFPAYGIHMSKVTSSFTTQDVYFKWSCNTMIKSTNILIKIDKQKSSNS